MVWPIVRIYNRKTVIVYSEITYVLVLIVGIEFFLLRLQHTLHCQVEILIVNVPSSNLVVFILFGLHVVENLERKQQNVDHLSQHSANELTLLLGSHEETLDCGKEHQIPVDLLLSRQQHFLLFSDV